MSRKGEDVSPNAGRGKGSPGGVRPTADLKRESPEKYNASLRIACRVLLEGRTLMQASRESGIPYSTLMLWRRRKTQGGAKHFWGIYDQEAAAGGFTSEGEPIEFKKVTTEGFSSPEQLADAYSLDATKIQIETMLDPKTAKKERLDAAKRIQDLGGHSPISRSVVVTAPIEDRRVAAALFQVLQEVRELRGPKQALIEGESEPA